jgi:hypothetical protein
MWKGEGLESSIKRVWLWVKVKGMVASIVFVLSMVVAILIPDFLIGKVVMFGIGWIGGLTASYLLQEVRK